MGSMKDFKEPKLHKNPAFKESSVEWSCPVTGLEMNGKHGFGFYWKCGCVAATRALQEINEPLCIVCSQPAEESDYIIMNAAHDMLELMEKNMVERKASMKKSKKGEKRAITKNDFEQAGPSSNAKKSKSSSSLAEKKKTTSISGVASSILRGTDFDGIRANNFSVAKNSEKSEAFKSIFDTHKSAEKKLK